MAGSKIDKLLAQKKFSRRPTSSKKSTNEETSSTTSTKPKQGIKKSLKKKIGAKKRVHLAKSPFKPGLIKISNIPFGFFEEELKNYFSQFGAVLETLVIRHSKTLKVKNYAYVKFAHLEVAKVAAETMNNYLMFEKVLKCKIIKNLAAFDRLVAKKSKFQSTRLRHQKAINAERSGAKERELKKKKLYKIQKDEKELAEKGIEFKCIILQD